MSNHETHQITATGDSLFTRIISILEQARADVVRQVYSSREPILSPPGREFKTTPKPLDADRAAILSPSGIELATQEKTYPSGTEFKLKCSLQIDLKMGELSYKDVGQMDGYVRMFDDLYTAEDDNPTIGLIMCTEKNEAVARYSVLNERKQIVASRYMLYLPTEEELAHELAKERKLIEGQLAERRSIAAADENDDTKAE